MNVPEGGGCPALKKLSFKWGLEEEPEGGRAECGIEVKIMDIIHGSKCTLRCKYLSTYGGSLVQSQTQ